MMELANDQQSLQNIVKKAWKDAAFKQKLIQNPVATIEHFLGRPVNLPQGKKLAFVDQSDPSTFFINIPKEPNLEDMELDEEQLDVIAGGGDAPPPVIVVL